MRMCRTTTPMVSLALILLVLVAACTPTAPEEGPQVRIIDPANFSTTARGGTIAIRALIEDQQGIALVKLSVEGQAAATELPDTPPVTNLTQELYWTPTTVGPHEVTVVAQDHAGLWGQSEPLTIYVVEIMAQQTVIAAQLATATPDPAASPTPIPSAATPPPPFTATPAACTNDSSYEADVTVLPGTQFEPGSAFDKTWRLRNIGTCTWGDGYQLVFLEGNQFSGQSPTDLPHEVAPDSTVDITVSMVAPDTPGDYVSAWQMQNPSGEKFGHVVYAVIQVVPSPATPTTSPIPSAPTNLTITAVRQDGFDFTWTDNSTNEQGFRLYNADTGQGVVNFAPNAASGSVGGLACGTFYRFYLVAFNESGESSPSNTAQNATSACAGP